MIRSLRISSLAWSAVPVGALVFLLWIHAGRIQHVRYLSGLGGGIEHRSIAAGGAEARAANGMILPEGLTGSYHWVLQTQQMFSRQEWRVRHIDYENAPSGRVVNAASPYRWWLGFVAACDQAISGQPIARSVERAALVADPLLQLLLVLGTTLLVAWRFGAFSAALTSIGLVVTFPFAANFVAGAPDDLGLAQLLAIGSVLLLIAGLRAPPPPQDQQKSAGRWFFVAGMVGGVGLWVSLSAQLAVLGGILAGALLAAWVGRQHRAEVAGLPWRAWALGGTVTTLLAYLAEFAPAHLGDWQMRSVHPLYGLAWLGGGELLMRLSAWIRGEVVPRTLRSVGTLVLATAALAAPFVVIWKYEDRAALIPDARSFQLTKLTEGVDAPTLLITVLPLLLVVPALWLLFRPKTGYVLRASVAIVLGPVLVALVFACQQLVWWNRVDALLLVMLAVVAAQPQDAVTQRGQRRVWPVLVLLLLLPGLFQLLPRALGGQTDKLSRSEMLGLIERDLAGWLARHASTGGVVVLAPPNETTALCYFGGLRGIGSLSWENKEGVAAAMRILSAPTAQEAKELIDQRGITHVVLLSWDSYCDAYARAGTGRVEGTFRDQLKLSTLPRWLRPVAYQLPTIEGFENQSATVFEVVEEQDEATALIRIAGYIVESGAVEQAIPVDQALQQFPANLGAWVARADIQQARGDEAELARSLTMLKRRLTAKQPPALVWDQRVRLAVILGKAKELNLARDQVAICLETADEGKLRALSAGSLYRLLVLSRAFDLTMAPRLHALALDLLPADLRGRLK